MDKPASSRLHLIQQLDKLLPRQIRIAKNLAQQTAPNIMTRMNRNSHNAAVVVLESNMAPTLANNLETGLL
jgi:hypothetical protein